MKLALHWKIIIGLVLGIIWAIISSSLGWSQFTLDWIDPFGKIFINLLKLIAVPLVFFSIISGVSNIGDPSSLGRMGGKTLVFYFITTIFAVSLGLIVVNLIKPGELINEETRTSNRIGYELWAKNNGNTIYGDLRLSELPENAALTKDIAERAGEEYDEATRNAVADKMAKAEKTMKAGPLQPLIDVIPSNIFISLGDNKLMLQVIFFAIFFGICLLFIPNEKAEPVKLFMDGAMEVFLKMVDIVMKGAPFFVFALLAGEVSRLAGNDLNKVWEIFEGLSWYSASVVAGLLFMIFISYPLIMKLFVKIVPYNGFFKAMSPAQTLAFSTSSSAATLPVTMECVEEKLGVDKKVTDFVLPIGATVNMDGTSLYQAVAVVFLAQFHMIDLTIAQQLTIVLTATLASIGSAAVPSAGLVMLIIVLESVGLNPAWIGIILPVDRILDMCRTVVNVTGDATVSSVIAKGEGLLNYPPKAQSAE